MRFVTERSAGSILLVLSMIGCVTREADVVLEAEGLPERLFVAGTTVVLSFFTEFPDRSFRDVTS